MSIICEPLNFLDLRRRMRERGDLAHITSMLEFAREVDETLRQEKFEELSPDTAIFGATLMRLQNLGTAAVYVSHATRSKYPEVPWRAIIRNRNEIIRHLLDPTYAEQWRFARENLPKIIPQLEHIVESISKSNER